MKKAAWVSAVRNGRSQDRVVSEDIKKKARQWGRDSKCVAGFVSLDGFFAVLSAFAQAGRGTKVRT